MPPRSARWRSSASASRRSHACGHGTPAASQSFGNADVGVIPGSVLSSFDEHAPAVLDEEVDPREAGAADAQERLDGEPAHALRPPRPGSAPAPRSSTPPSEYFAS